MSGEQLEKLATLMHKHWSDIINYIVHGKFSREEWLRKVALAQKPYSELSEAEQEVCRGWARKFLALMNGD